jgi:hypothetical protein
MIVVKLMTSKHADKVVLLPPILSAVQTRWSILAISYRSQTDI